jgi:small GTP-binding protein
MVLFNYATKEITMKIVYYGPGLCGKTTNLQYIHSRLNPKTRGKLISLATETDRTLFFDFLPMEIGTLKGFKIRFQLYTVPGQVRYNATRKLVLKGSDGVVFVADSQRALMDQNIESLENLKENLVLNGLDPNDIPLVLQFNKRDLKDISPVPELNEMLNYKGVPFFQSVAIRGDGVLETFKEITRILLKEMSEKHKLPSPVPEIVSGEEIQPTVEIERGVTEEVTPEVLEAVEEETMEPTEYLTPAEDIGVIENVPEGAECSIELETLPVEETPVIESAPTIEEVIEEKPFKYHPTSPLEEISDLLKGIKESIDSLSEVLPWLKKAQEGLYRRIVENEEAHLRKTEEILKSLNEIKVKVESLMERPEKRWFRIR